jgi:hypothetical protein
VRFLAISALPYIVFVLASLLTWDFMREMHYVTLAVTVMGVVAHLIADLVIRPTVWPGGKSDARLRPPRDASKGTRGR